MLWRFEPPSKLLISASRNWIGTKAISLLLCFDLSSNSALVQCLEVLNLISKESKTHIRYSVRPYYIALVAQVVQIQF